MIVVLCIEVKYPDEQKYLIIPPASDLKRLSVLRYRLVSKVVLSHVLWSGKSSDGYDTVQLHLVSCSDTV